MVIFENKVLYSPIFVVIQEANYPSHFLDLMSVCWEQDPLFRPTAAQIRMVASCPQFCHLADAVSMETQAVVLSACSISGCDSVSGSVQ